MGSVQKAFNTVWDAAVAVSSFKLLTPVLSAETLWKGESYFSDLVDLADSGRSRDDNKKSSEGIIESEDLGNVSSEEKSSSDLGSGETGGTTASNVGGVGTSDAENELARKSTMSKGGLAARGANVFENNRNFGFTKTLGV